MKAGRARLRDGSVVVGQVVDDAFVAAGDDGPAATLNLLATAQVAKGERIPLAEVQLLCPVASAPSVRDFMIFEAHARNARAGTGTEVPQAFYDAPIFYFTNPAALFGPGDPIVVPSGSRMLDFELEVACLIGREASDLDPDDPATCDVIAGFMLMNDWSARDLQMREMGGGLGPAKGKDFATSLGPWIATPDELPTAGEGRWSCPLQAYVNGRRVGGGDLDSAHFSWSQVLAQASANTRLVPGDVIGSGTVGTGCLIELRALGFKDENPWLRAGDVVQLEGGPLGSLSNPIVDRIQATTSSEETR